MTYHREYDDPRFQRSGLGEYPGSIDTGTGSSKWTVLTVVAIFAIIGTFILFPSKPPVSTDAANESTVQQPAVTPQTTVTD